MALIVNGEAQQLPTPATVSGLIASLNLQNRRLAVELNGAIVPRSGWDHTPLGDGDRIELVKAIGGG